MQFFFLRRGHVQPSTLAHELGHAQYYKKGRSKNIFARAAHKAYDFTDFLLPGNAEIIAGKKRIPLDKLANGGFFAHGVASGYKNEKNNQREKKNSLWKRTRAVILPAAVTAPILVAEGAASLKGLKMMKKAGASKELLKESKKNFGHAYGTYLSVLSRPIISGASGELVGRGLAKATNLKTKRVPDKTEKVN